MDIWPLGTERTRDGTLTIGGCSIPALAEQFGTPLYVYDRGSLVERARAFRQAFAGRYPDARVVYAAKAFLCPAIVQLLAAEGLGLDVASGGELHVGLAAGIDAAAITLHGNNKSREELSQAIERGVGLIVVDNSWEIELLKELVGDRDERVRVALRLNPGIGVHTHAKIRTGYVDSKFGFQIADGSAEAAVAAISELGGLELVGYHMHLGSQLFDAQTYAEGAEILLEFAAAMQQRHGVRLQTLITGGGFGIPYLEGTAQVDLDAWAELTVQTVTSCCDQLGLDLPELVIEPGRAIVGTAGVAVYRVGSSKDIPGVRRYVAVDGGMADNIRPALYGARYEVELANRISREAADVVTIAGKYCESGDVLIEGARLPPVVPGDLLAMPAAGAYCLSMASNYNHALRPAVVLVEGGDARLIRRRETYADLLARECWEV